MTALRPSRTTVTLIRYIFPNAIPAWAVHVPGRRTPGSTEIAAEYCVGGALYMYSCGVSPAKAAFEQRFPSVATLGRVLRKMQPLLTMETARQFAAELILTNDDPALGGPAAAWSIVDAALDDDESTATNIIDVLRRKAGF